MNGDKIRFAKEFVRGNQLHPEFGGRILGNIRIICQHPHFHAQGPIGHNGANTPQADYTQGLIVELGTDEFLLLPLTSPHRLVGPGDMPC